MDRRALVYLLALLVGACTNTKENGEILPVKYNYESKDQAMVDWPGLFQKVDTSLVIIDIVDNERTVVKRFFYEGQSDTFWTKVVERLKQDTSTSVGADTLGRKIRASPFSPDTTKVVVYFMNGFEDSKVTVVRNEETVYMGTVEFFTADIQLGKTGLERITIFIDDKKVSLKIKPDYNFIELIKSDSALVCNYRYYIPII